MDGMHPLLRSGLGLFREAIAPVSESIWWGPGDSLYWCNSLEGSIHISALGTAINGLDDRVTRVPPILAAFAPAPDGYVIAGVNAVAIVSPLGGFVRTLARVPHASDQIRFNEAKCDPYGRLVLGTTGFDGFSSGSLYSVDPSGEWRAIYNAAGLVTGMQWSDDGSRMWFTDTRVSTIFTCDYTPQGEMRNVRPFVVGVRGEGLARDAHGGFWTGGGGRNRALGLHRSSRPSSSRSPRAGSRPSHSGARSCRPCSSPPHASGCRRPKSARCHSAVRSSESRPPPAGSPPDRSLAPDPGAGTRFQLV